MTEIITRIEVNTTTGEEKVIPLTQAELAKREFDAQAYAEQQALVEAELVAKAAAKISAEAKFAALGLTPEEIAAIIA